MNDGDESASEAGIHVAVDERIVATCENKKKIICHWITNQVSADHPWITQIHGKYHATEELKLRHTIDGCPWVDKFYKPLTVWHRQPVKCKPEMNNKEYKHVEFIGRVQSLSMDKKRSDLIKVEAIKALISTFPFHR